MEQTSGYPDRETFSCSICMDLLKDPVTLPCGHSYCSSCINICWDGEGQSGIHSCPQCKKSFHLRPELVRNTMLEALVEELKKPKVGAPADRRIQDRDKDVKVLEPDVTDINLSADKAVEHSQEVFSQLIHLMEKRSSDVKQQIRSLQDYEVSRLNTLAEDLVQEMAELKSKDAELEQVLHGEYGLHLPHSCSSALQLCTSTQSYTTELHPRRYFEDLTAAVSESREKLQELLKETHEQTSR